jgi:hypothetical protein
VLENVRFCNPIQRGNFPTEWMAQPRSDRLRQPARGTDTQAPHGGRYWRSSGRGNPWWRRIWTAGGRRRWKPTKTGK